jgi:transposase
MKSNKEFLKENIEDIIKLRNSGMYLKDIAEKYGVSKSSIGRALKEVDIVTRKELTDEDVKEIIKLYTVDELTLRELGLIFHKDPKIISSILEENNINRVSFKKKNIQEKTITDETQLYIDEFNNGLIISEIAKKYNKTYSYIHNKIKDYVKLRERKEITYEDELNIIELYESGKSSVEIGNMYGVHYTRITKILENHGIDRNYASNRKYKLNETYFDNINTPNKAYILGFLYADGSNHKPKKTISMSL